MKNVTSNWMINVVLLLSACAVSVVSASMVYWAIYGDSSGRSFLLDFVEDPSLYFVSFVSPLVIALACCLAVILRFKGNPSRFPPEWAPMIVLTVLIVVNMVITGGVGYIALAAPFILAAWIVAVVNGRLHAANRGGSS